METKRGIIHEKGSVSAGIVTYNNASEIVPCLNSLIECTKDMDVDIYVFDNCSQDETVPVIRQYFPRVHVIESRENLGFGRGHNEILKKISSEFHMVVNPDIQFTPKAVQKLTAFLVHYPQVGIVTPKIKNVDGSEQLLPKRDPKFSYVVLSKFRPLQFLETNIRGPEKALINRHGFYPVQVVFYDTYIGVPEGRRL